jgi:lantibiotic transport system permease protein
MDYSILTDVNLGSSFTLATGYSTFLVLTIGMILLSIIWINNWPGRKTID